MEHKRLADAVYPDRYGPTTYRALCSCGWVSAKTASQQHLGRAFRSHAKAVSE